MNNYAFFCKICLYERSEAKTVFFIVIAREHSDRGNPSK